MTEPLPGREQRPIPPRGERARGAWRGAPFGIEMVRDVLQDAVDKHRAICAFDFSAFTPPPPVMLLLGNPLGMLLATPFVLGMLLATPFVRPFRWSRPQWTYVIPVVPIFYAWDALVSGLRLYSVRELQEIVNGLPANEYVWEIRREHVPRSITYLLGRPDG